jgi:DNA repair exonuclease SbcCD ATPase subunit
MLRANTRKLVNDTLEESYFGVDNFDVQFGATAPSVLKITFLPEPVFELSVSINATGDRFWVKEVPGVRLLTAETFNTGDFEQVVDRIGLWVARIKEDILARNPFAKEIQELRASITERLDKGEEDLEGYFTSIEAAALSERLKTLAATVERLAESNAELEGAVEALTSTVAELQEAATTVNRGTWYRMTSGRLLSGLKKFAKAKEVREFALEAAKQLLLPGPD